jgi:hypothetical protein
MASTIPAGSFFQRVNASLGSAGDNIAIEGYKYPIIGEAGSHHITLDARSAFGVCTGVQPFYLALFVPLGTNEFGAELGYSLSPNYRPPALLYNCSSACVSGGHAPPAGTRGLCPNAAWVVSDIPAGGWCLAAAPRRCTATLRGEQRRARRNAPLFTRQRCRGVAGGFEAVDGQLLARASFWPRKSPTCRRKPHPMLPD